MNQIAKKGKMYKIIKLVDKINKRCDFKIGDIVISLEDSDVPYVVKADKFNGNFNTCAYDNDDWWALMYGEELEEI